MFSPFAAAVDSIVVNGKIITVEDRFTVVQALAIKNQRIVATGSNADIRKLAEANTKVIDVKGRTVIPGLIDNHSHWIRAAEHDEFWLNVDCDKLAEVATEQDIITLTRCGVRYDADNDSLAMFA